MVYYVLGLGLSGLGSAEFLLFKGKKVVGMDKNAASLKQKPKVQELMTKGLTVLSDKDAVYFSREDKLILSPGIPLSHPICEMARSEGMEIIGEVELAFRFLKQKCIGITGTNGKTTVTLLIEHILQSAGLKARALGNVGDPLTQYLLNPDPEEIIVAEMSSYQLEILQQRCFDAAVILNITPDHLDRYGTMEEYAKAKCKILECMKEGGVAYVHTDVEREYKSLLNKSSYRTYGSGQDADVNLESIEYLFPLGYRKGGRHDKENALAAFALVQKFNVTGEVFCKSLESFKKPPHRIEFVKTVDGVTFIDDSKGTNIDAVVQAVNAMQGPVMLIAGGVDKGASYTPWNAFRDKVKCIYAIGEAKDKIAKELDGGFKVKREVSLSAAVNAAFAHAEAGDVVLLSPGCSSFDMFRDYVHRGEEFKKVIDLIEERRKS